VKENWDYTAFDEQIAFCFVSPLSLSGPP